MINKLIVHGLIKIDKKILVIKRTKIKRGKPNMYPLCWDIPGGMVEEGELPQEALIRECKEEVGLDVNINRIIHETSNIDKEKEIVFTTLVYKCELINSKKQDINLQLDEHSEYKLIKGVDEIKQKIVPFVEKVLKQYI